MTDARARPKAIADTAPRRKARQAAAALIVAWRENAAPVMSALKWLAKTPRACASGATGRRRAGPDRRGAVIKQIGVFWRAEWCSGARLKRV